MGGIARWPAGADAGARRAAVGAESQTFETTHAQFFGGEPRAERLDQAAQRCGDVFRLQQRLGEVAAFAPQRHLAQRRDRLEDPAERLIEPAAKPLAETARQRGTR